MSGRILATTHDALPGGSPYLEYGAYFSGNVGSVSGTGRTEVAPPVSSPTPFKAGRD